MNNLGTKISAIITAGGLSVRYGKNKLLEKIPETNKTVIETTVEKFIDIVDEIVIPAHDDVLEFLLKSEIYCNKIKFAPPGATRQKSVYNAILTCSNPKYVLIHDGARPFISIDTIQKTLDALLIHDAVVVGIKAVDTIKRIKDNKIIETLNRDEIFQAQTPQGFSFDLIKKVHIQYQDTSDFTDDSSMAEAYGARVFVVLGETSNKKITIKDDLY